eukprot:jgi/Mesvir1/26894/Mv20624-RA.1
MYAGGQGVGGSLTSTQDVTCTKKWPNMTSPTYTVNPGDLPSKVKAIADAACVYNLTWEQNTRSSYYMKNHVEVCGAVDKAMVQATDVNAVVLQAQSEELSLSSCLPTTLQVSQAVTLLKPAPAIAKLFVVETWADQSKIDSSGRHAEICMFEKLKCSVASLARNVTAQLGNGNTVRVIPEGQAWRAIADAACTKSSVSCTCLTKGTALTSCGYSSCGGLWGPTNGSGLFNTDGNHQTDAVGAWLNALVTYGSFFKCIPPATLLTRLNVASAATLTEAAATALTNQLRLDYPTQFPSGTTVPACVDAGP